MKITEEELIGRGFRKFNTVGHLSDVRRYLFQKRYLDDKDNTLYFLDIYKYDWKHISHIPIADIYNYEITTQLYRKGSHDAINISFGSDTTIDDAEEFINKLFDIGLIEPYE